MLNLGSYTRVSRPASSSNSPDPSVQNPMVFRITPPGCQRTSHTRKSTATDPAKLSHLADAMTINMWRTRLATSDFAVSDILELLSQFSYKQAALLAGCSRGKLFDRVKAASQAPRSVVTPVEISQIEISDHITRAGAIYDKSGNVVDTTTLLNWYNRLTASNYAPADVAAILAQFSIRQVCKFTGKSRGMLDERKKQFVTGVKRTRGRPDTLVVQWVNIDIDPSYQEDPLVTELRSVLLRFFRRASYVCKLATRESSPVSTRVQRNRQNLLKPRFMELLKADSKNRRKWKNKLQCRCLRARLCLSKTVRHYLDIIEALHATVPWPELTRARNVQLQQAQNNAQEIIIQTYGTILIKQSEMGAEKKKTKMTVCHRTLGSLSNVPDNKTPGDYFHVRCAEIILTKNHRGKAISPHDKRYLRGLGRELGIKSNAIEHAFISNPRQCEEIISRFSHPRGIRRDAITHASYDQISADLGMDKQEVERLTEQALANARTKLLSALSPMGIKVEEFKELLASMEEQRAARNPTQVLWGRSSTMEAHVSDNADHEDELHPQD